MWPLAAYTEHTEHLDVLHREQYLPETYLIIIGFRNIRILY
nr:MAG TPA: hypothetical protein [Bacteriophage sp.]DAM40116.1 MAG TPA: hypothetical protein [Caudoviricetes sp.]